MTGERNTSRETGNPDTPPVPDAPPVPNALAVHGLSDELTRVVEAASRGDAASGDRLLQLVYDELRVLARSRMARERRGGGGTPTLDTAGLVHEAYLRLVGDDKGKPQRWDGRGHFFGAAALAMRRILVERARHRGRLKHGGGRERLEFHEHQVLSKEPEHDGTDLIALDEALTKLDALDARKAKVVSLRYFAGLSVEETAAALDVSPATVKNEWAFARAWLHRELSGEMK